MEWRWRVGGFVLLMAAALLTYSELRAGSKPEDATGGQPIKFNHASHVLKAGMQCQYCHMYADRSTVAGLPTIQKCMGCHKYVKPESPEIQKLAQYWENRQPIVWRKVHDLPDFVYFNHSRHIKRGVQCEQCHGNVGEMTVAVKQAPLTMGWCVTCHRRNRAPLDCWTCHK
ncbi:MAG: cytochrome c family protein [Candidatus Hydrothermae bacterium]|nr:cytochrome c family protein [Candidatus Hydrothermae bacterium]